jgi:hypothetical protein
MSEHETEQGTGLARVDAVVESVEALDGRPVDEHVAVFEQAHDALRRALDDAPDQVADQGDEAPDQASDQASDQAPDA